jgi:hypothetical protein
MENRMIMLAKNIYLLSIIRQQAGMESFNGGTKYIIEKFQEIDDSIQCEEHYVPVQHPTIVPGLLIIWKSSIFGEKNISMGMI